MQLIKGRILSCQLRQIISLEVQLSVLGTVLNSDMAYAFSEFDYDHHLPVVSNGLTMTCISGDRFATEAGIFLLTTRTKQMFESCQDA